MKVVDIRKLSMVDMEKELLASKKELFNLRVQFAAGEQANTAAKKSVRRKIARIKTIMNQERMK